MVGQYTFKCIAQYPVTHTHRQYIPLSQQLASAETNLVPYTGNLWAFQDHWPSPFSLPPISNGHSPWFRDNVFEHVTAA
jgi:hypothetical protein